MLMVAVGLVLSGGCGGGGGTPVAPVAARIAAPAVTVQPVSQSVPMGLSATYSVTAAGSSLQYQWARDGALLAGATASTYVTPPTQFTDTGATFTVTVSNPGGSVTSSAASLTVTARAPREGDLRFQQVDASWTVNGYGKVVGESSDVPGRGAVAFSGSFGTPLFMGAGDCSIPPTTDGLGCAWFFSELPASNAGLTVGYMGDSYASFPQDLVSNAWPTTNGTTPASSNSVVTSLDLEPANILFGVSWLQETSNGGFDSAVHTVAPAALQAAATEEGASGRVITALSHDTGGITYVSYGWQIDQTTLYEAQAVTTTSAGAPAAAANLAAQGYIITAVGLADANGNIVLVGTRVQGDTLPRAFVAAHGSAQLQSMWQQGYAPVGVIVNLTQSDPTIYLGER